MYSISHYEVISLSDLHRVHHLGWVQVHHFSKPFEVALHAGQKVHVLGIKRGDMMGPTGNREQLIL